MSLTDLYQRSPLAVQEAFATGYGLRELTRRHGPGFRRKVGEFDARQWWSRSELERDQASRLRSMVVWSVARVPYYRDLFSELGIDPMDIQAPADLTALPLLDKETVRANPERFLPVPPNGRTVAQTTGGTTGTPLRYWASVEAVRTNYATYESRTRAWAGVKFGQRMASFHGQPIVPDSQVGGPYWRHNPAFNQQYFSVYHLNDSTVPEYLEQLRKFDPKVIAGYTSAVHRVALGIIEADAVGTIRPSAILVSSEMLTPAARADIELAFGCRVTNSYSLGELVAYVSECEAGELHVSTEYGVVELLDTEAGSEIVATGLINRAMPLLRYRTGDMAVAFGDDEHSTCGRNLPCLKEIVGRVDDVVRTPEGAVVGPAPMSLAFQRVPNLRRAQAHQSSPDQVRILLEPAEGFSKEDEDFLRHELRRRLGPTIAIDLERVDSIGRTSGGKERLVISTIGSANGDEPRAGS
ncbi:MAG: hypothetical protein WBA45_00340 [Microthrixaceae bacterium]